MALMTASNSKASIPSSKGKKFNYFPLTALLLLVIMMMTTLFLPAPRPFCDPPGRVCNRDGSELNGSEYRRVGHKLQEKAEYYYNEEHGTTATVSRIDVLSYKNEVDLGMFDKKEMLDQLTRMYGRRNALLAYKALEQSERDFLVLLIH